MLPRAINHIIENEWNAIASKFKKDQATINLSPAEYIETMKRSFYRGAYCAAIAGGSVAETHESFKQAQNVLEHIRTKCHIFFYNPR